MVGAMILAVAIILARGSETLNYQIITVLTEVNVRWITGVR